MLIATITALILLFGGGGGLEFYLTNVKDAVEDNVHDEKRQKAILAASDALSKEMESMKKDVQSKFHEYIKLHNGYNSKPADFDAVTAGLLENQHKLSKMVLDARDKMHEQMTKAEWEAVFKQKK